MIGIQKQWRKKEAASFLCLLLISISTLGQSVQHRFYRLNENQGLANGFINQITQDTLGFMWIASNDGLYRFDGKQFQSYRATTKNSIPDNTINDLLVDKKNNVYAATNNGLAIYSNEWDSISTYLPLQILGTGNDNTITSLARSEGAIYLGTSGSGVIQYESGNFSELELKTNNTIEFDDISDLCFEGNTLWIASWTQGVLRYNTLNAQIDVIPLPSELRSNTYISELFVDSYNRVWIGTNKGILIVTNNGSRLSMAYLQNMPTTVDALSIYEDQKGIVWVGTRDDGLFGISEIEIKHFPPTRDGTSVSHRTISSIFQDFNGNLWLGTHNNGIDVFDPAGEIVKNINPVRFEKTNDYLSESVWGIHEAEDGLWLGTDGSGLYHYSTVSDHVELVASTASKLKLTDDAILSIEVANDGRLWLGTYSGGINVLDLKEETVVSYGSANSNLTSNDIRVIFEDKKSSMWIGTNRGGLYEFEKESNQLKKVVETTALDIRGIIEDEKNEFLWLATYGDGLVKYDPKNSELEYFDWTINLRNQQPIALSINQSEEHILIGTMQSGLVMFNKLDKSFTTFGETDGIINNTIRSIYIIDHSIWMSTNTGLSVLNTNNSNIQNFDSFDGLQKGHYNDGSLVYGLNGRLILGGIHGMDIFDPRELLLNQYFPKVTFTELKIDNEVIRPSTSTSISASLPIANLITIYPSQDVFNISFNVIAFPNALGWSFEYLMEGFDDTWTTGIESNNATYRNVPPGNYIFKVRSVDRIGGRTGEISAIMIEVLPPWWKTIYAYFGFVVLFFLIGWFVYRNVKDKISMRQKLYYEKKLRQQEFETMQDKIRFYTNFSHEMKTPISLISGPVNDLLRSELIPASSKKSLRLIKRNAQSLLKLVNRLLEFRKIETENTALNVGNHDLTILAQEEAESFSYLAKDREVKFGFYCETDVRAWIDIEKFQIIINNLLLNALKYSEPNSKVTFKVLHESPHVVIIVSDEGRGIAKEELEHIFIPFYQAKNSIGTGGTGIGLALCKSFVELHGGTIEVQSELGKGATFKVMIPEDRKHFEGQEHVRFSKVTQGEIDDSIPMEEIESSEVAESEQVLLIADDNRDIRLYVASLFEQHFKVLQASDGKKALELAKETVPDIIISDIMMPSVDGLEFCKNIKENTSTSHVPVILLTAKGTSQTKVEGYEVGADGYITKPFDSEVLTARVNNLLESREKLKDLHLSGHWIENNDAPSKEIEFILKVEAAVLDMMPNGDLNVIQLCRELGFSRTSLYRKIKSLTGQSIKQFIRSIKLKRAAEMLATEDMSVSEVAFSLDFTDLKYFRTCFKKQYDKLPSEYQNEMKSRDPIDQEAIRKAVKI